MGYDRGWLVLNVKDSETRREPGFKRPRQCQSLQFKGKEKSVRQVGKQRSGRPCVG